MKRIIVVLSLVVLVVMVTAMPAFAGGPPEGAGHQRVASELKGDVADLVPGHVAAAHQAAAADLKGGVAELVPEHVAQSPNFDLSSLFAFLFMW